jgi:hypothetical protein
MYNLIFFDFFFLIINKMSNLSSSNVTSGFIDLATFDELEKYMYGGGDATAYFVRDTCKATWFTQVPVVLSKASGSPGFDTEWSVSISRAGDYLLSTWLRLTTPEIKLHSSFTKANKKSMRWTRNFMHNLIRECNITFNDLVAARFDNYHLDFWTAFTVPAGKRTGYNNMIGNFDDLTQPHYYELPPPNLTPPIASAYENYGKIPAATLNLPLPFFFSRDTGVALPTAALPYNDMRINFSFRDWTHLLEVDDENLVGTGVNPTVPAKLEDFSSNTPPSLTNVNVWANYAIVSNDERKRMACAPRDILIEQVQTAPRQTFLSSNDKSPRYDIRFSHAIKALFFACRNTTTKCDWSNYTAGSPVVRTINNVSKVDWDTDSMVDPIRHTSLIYENTNRLSQMGSDYFSLVNPYYHSPSIPLETGYHMYSYSLDFMSLDPMGSTNYGKLTNVSIVPEASPDAVVSSQGNWPTTVGQGALVPGGTPNGGDFDQTWEFITTAVSNNIIRISGGALGFPVL